MNKEISSNQLISNIIAGIEKVKGTDITIMDLREVENTVCDYFILCNGSSNTQVSAISGAIQKIVSQADGHQHPMDTYRLCRCSRSYIPNKST